MMPKQDWETVNDDWAMHDLARGAQQDRPFADIVAGRYGKVQNLADFARKSQLADYEAWRAMYEGRFASLFHPCTGVLAWMSNPSQPSFVWQIYAHDLEPLCALFAAQKACEPVHIEMTENDFHVTVVNQTPNQLEGLHVVAKVYNLDGTVQLEGRSTVTAAATSATDLGPIEWPPGLSEVHFIRLELRDSTNRLVSDNFYWRALPDHPDDFTALQRLPAAVLDASVSQRNTQDKCLLEVTLTNSSPNVALLAHLQLHKAGGARDRVLPVYYSENFVSLVPGESRKITIEASMKDLAGDAPLVLVDGYNVALRGNTPAIALNTNTQVASWPQGVFRASSTQP